MHTCAHTVAVRRDGHASSVVGLLPSLGATRMKTVGLLFLTLISAVILAACEGQRLAQCDPANTPNAIRGRGGRCKISDMWNMRGHSRGGSNLSGQVSQAGRMLPSVIGGPRACAGVMRAGLLLQSQNFERLWARGDVLPSVIGGPGRCSGVIRSPRRRGSVFWRQGEAEHLGGLEVDHQFVLGWHLHRQVGRLFAFEDAIDIARRASELIDEIRPIGE